MAVLVKGARKVTAAGDCGKEGRGALATLPTQGIWEPAGNTQPSAFGSEPCRRSHEPESTLDAPGA
jgi:hypothetical protein